MYITVNGINLFYEKSGSGRPILLIHGNSETHKIFDVLTRQLEGQFTVYAPDSRNHGKSGKTRTLGYEMMAEDIAAFIDALGLEKPILYGFSDGGIIGLLLASKYPDLLSKLVISGANTEPGAVKEKIARVFRIGFFFLRDVRISMMLQDPHITAEDLHKITIPVLVLAGEDDVIKEENTRFIAEHIPKSVLKILPGETHPSYVVHSPKLYPLIKEFLV